MEPVYSGAGRPEKRVQARSKPPHQKCDGLDLPRNRPRNVLKTRSESTRICQQRCAASASYDAWILSSLNGSASAISTGTGHNLTSMSSERSIDLYSP